MVQKFNKLATAENFIRNLILENFGSLTLASWLKGVME